MVSRLGKAKKTRGKSQHTNKHRSPIPLIIEKIIEEADIILEILDARFIEKTRNREIEKKVKKLKKTLIYVFNKSDLIDTNKIRNDFELENLKPYVFFSSKNRKGSGDLKKLIKIESKKIRRDSVSIGIVGYPNTGKSSLINFITGKASTRTSPESGHTKGIQKIKLSENLYLIDTPGIISEKEKSSGNIRDSVKHSQIGAVTWDKAKNPDMIVFKIMEEYPQILEKHYKINANGDSELLIEELGKKLRYLKKGNLIDEIRTSKKILKDWQEGKIKI